MRRGILIRTAGIIVLVCGVGVAFGKGGEAATVRLVEESTLTHESCLPPCACPAGTATVPMRGSMMLVTEVEEPPVYFRYRIEQAVWAADPPRGAVVLTGGGTYEMFGDFVLQERLAMQLSVNGGSVETYDTGVVFGGSFLTATGPQILCDRYTISVRWEPVCRADFNGDGLLNPDDLSEFVTCFFLELMIPGTCGLGDFNADGLVNPDDLSEFITTFFLSLSGGCG